MSSHAKILQEAFDTEKGATITPIDEARHRLFVSFIGALLDNVYGVKTASINIVGLSQTRIMIGIIKADMDKMSDGEKDEHLRDIRRYHRFIADINHYKDPLSDIISLQNVFEHQFPSQSFEVMTAFPVLEKILEENRSSVDGNIYRMYEEIRPLFKPEPPKGNEVSVDWHAGRQLN